MNDHERRKIIKKINTKKGGVVLTLPRAGLTSLSRARWESALLRAGPCLLGSDAWEGANRRVVLTNGGRRQAVGVKCRVSRKKRNVSKLIKLN